MTFLDSSVILAVLMNESIDEEAHLLIDGGVMSAVNLAEVYSKLAELKLSVAPHVDVLIATLGRIEPFTAEQARSAAVYAKRPGTLDCRLATGPAWPWRLNWVGKSIYTTDVQWAKADVGCEVHLLR